MKRGLLSKPSADRSTTAAAFAPPLASASGRRLSPPHSPATGLRCCEPCGSCGRSTMKRSGSTLSSPSQPSRADSLEPDDEIHWEQFLGEFHHPAPGNLLTTV